MGITARLHRPDNSLPLTTLLLSYYDQYIVNRHSKGGNLKSSCPTTSAPTKRTATDSNSVNGA